MKSTTTKQDKKKTIRVRRLRDIMPYEVALVPRGANGRSFLVVKADEDPQARAAMAAHKDGDTMQISLEALSKAHSQLGEIVNVLKSGTPDITTEQALSQKLESMLRELASVDVIKSDALAGHLQVIKELTDRLAVTSRDIGTIDPIDQLQVAVAKALDAISSQATSINLGADMAAAAPVAPVATTPVAAVPVVAPTAPTAPTAPVAAPVIAPVAPIVAATPAAIPAVAPATPVVPATVPAADPVAELVKSITSAVKAGVAEAMAALKPATVVATAPLPTPQAPIAAVAKADTTVTTPALPAVSQGSQGEVVGRGKPSVDWPEDFNTAR